MSKDINMSFSKPIDDESNISNINSAINAIAMTSPYFNKDFGTYEPPDDLKVEGLLTYANAQNWNPGQKGFYYYDGSNWIRLESLNNKGQASGYCELDSSARVPENRIPQSVFPVNLAVFPAIVPNSASSGGIVPMRASGGAVTTVALTSGRIYWFPFYCSINVVNIQLSVNVTTAASGTHQLGIYDSDASGYITNLIASGTFSAGTTGTKTVTLNNVNLKRGRIYWLAWYAASAPTVSAVAQSSARVFRDGLGTSGILYWYTSGTELPSTAPSSFTVAVDVSVPSISIT